jgi:hypothetical protein
MQWVALSACRPRKNISNQTSVREIEYLLYGESRLLQDGSFSPISCRLSYCRCAVGNTVNLKEPIWTNTIGNTELTAVWMDPEFNPKQKAFYDVRVLEIPTPR